MKFEGAIFDLDGTLLDSMPIWRNLGKEYLRSKGISKTPENLNEILKPMSLMQSAQYFKAEFNINESQEEIIVGINALINRQYCKEVPLKPFVKPFLQKLQSAGVKMCVATALDKFLSIAALERLGIDHYFSSILTCTELGLGKDNPEFFIKAQESLGTPVDKTIIFEDSLHAVMNAKRAGLFVVGVYDESANEDIDKIKNYSDLYLYSFDEWEMNN